MSLSRFVVLLGLLLTFPAQSYGHGTQLVSPEGEEMQWVAVRAENREKRTELVNAGLSIETVVQDMSYGYAPPSIIEAIKAKGFVVVSSFPASEFAHLGFPAEDAIYNDYSEMSAELEKLAKDYPGLVHRFSIGKSLEGREIWAIRLNRFVNSGTQPSGLPGIVFMGGHHAREHLSVEVPLKLARFLAEREAGDDGVSDLLKQRDIFIIPMVNPDGAEFDISGEGYKSWRKNRRANSGSRCMGVDLNRNYGFKWGTGGSSNNACSDVFMGPQPFSEPETQAVKAFVEARPNLKVLLSYHTFSELILYPWGHTYDPIGNRRDQTTFETMARTMSQWNGYTPQPSSDLYIASGDTTDWAYGTLGMFAFTFELSPRDQWSGGGFYPGPGAVETSFQANIKPALYLIDLAQDPYRAATAPETVLFYGR
jgi:carboxypeptidase T